MRKLIGIMGIATFTLIAIGVGIVAAGTTGGADESALDKIMQLRQKEEIAGKAYVDAALNDPVYKWARAKDRYLNENDVYTSTDTLILFFMDAKGLDKVGINAAMKKHAATRVKYDALVAVRRELRADVDAYVTATMAGLTENR